MHRTTYQGAPRAACSHPRPSDGGSRARRVDLDLLDRVLLNLRDDPRVLNRHHGRSVIGNVGLVLMLTLRIVGRGGGGGRLGVWGWDGDGEAGYINHVGLFWAGPAGERRTAIVRRARPATAAATSTRRAVMMRMGSKQAVLWCLLSFMVVQSS
jgi:hypothetical protein